MIGFDNELYLTKQKENILKRINEFQGKLYLEFGGKIVDDFHASRVLLGYDPNVKIKLLASFKNDLEIIICVNAGDIDKTKMRSDLGITYDMDVLRLIDNFNNYNISINSIVITQYKNQKSVDTFMSKLKMRNIKYFIHYPIQDYPFNIENIVSENGFGKNPYIETTKSLVVITAPGPGSGKLATCLNQIYHEHKNGCKAGYAKFETFPIWNFPLKHPINLAYEAATVDLNDINMIDIYHLEAYNITTVNYNRDIEAFPIVKTILSKINENNKNIYLSPTDMGVNMVGYAILNDEIVKESSKQEIIRRYYDILCDFKKGLCSENSIEKIKSIITQSNINIFDRKVVESCLNHYEKVNKPTCSLQLKDGTIILGSTSELMTSSSAVFLNALKFISKINPELKLIVPIVLEPIIKLKKEVFGFNSTNLQIDEMLNILFISAVTNSASQMAIEKIFELKGTEMHSSHLLNSQEIKTLKNLGIRITCSPEYSSKNLFFN